MMADGGSKIGFSSSQPTVSDHAGPIIEESQKSEEYQQDLQVVLGTAFGVVAMVGILAVVFLLCRIYKARHATVPNNTNDDHEAFERDITVDVEGKSQPVVLLLYAYDCLIHEKVVSALASFLMEACGVTVTYDLLEENEIVERGVDDWLVDRLQEVDYILVLCSLGARLRCSKKRVRFKSDSQRVLPDYFAVAVDYVAEKMRAEKQKGLGLNKFVTAYMEYSTRSDIPPQLDLAVQFCLMKDIHKLHLHLNTYGPDLDKSDTSSQSSMCENHYHETETGAVLKATIEQARAFFREHPCWMDDQIDQPSIAGPARAQKYKHKSLKQPFLALIGAPPVLEYSLLSQCQDKCTRTDGDPETTETFKMLGSGQELSGTVGIFQGRQNSLPSSLASSHVGISSTQHALSRSMNSFATDQPDCDGLPCLYCNNLHMDNRWECRHSRNQTSRNVAVKPSQISLQDPPHNLDTNRSPTTVLQAEVHQEWGLSTRGTPEKKSATFGGDIRSWTSDNEVSMEVAHFQSLPPHHQYKPYSFTMTEWNSRPETGRSVCHDDHKLTRSLSSLSLSTLDSCSVSDGDSLERDLRSIQNISSFQDFFSSSSFTSGMLTPRIVTASANSGTEMTHILHPCDGLSSHQKSTNTNIV